MGRTLGVAGGWAAAGFGYGYAMANLIARPDDVGTFWLGNLCAPWLVLAFAAGAGQRAWRWAVAGGVAADVACFLGSYADEVLRTHSVSWFSSNIQWLVAALGSGVGYGLLGHWWRRTRSVVAACLLGGGFVAEPLLWRAYDGYYQGPGVIWAVEVSAGLAACVAGVLWRRARVSAV